MMGSELVATLTPELPMNLVPVFIPAPESVTVTTVPPAMLAASAAVVITMKVLVGTED